MICAQLRRCGAPRDAATGRGARAARRRRRPGHGAARTRRRLFGVAAPLPLRGRYWWRRRRGALVDVPPPRRRRLAGARSDWRRVGASLLRRRAGGLGRAGARSRGVTALVDRAPARSSRPPPAQSLRSARCPCGGRRPPPRVWSRRTRGSYARAPSPPSATGARHCSSGAARSTPNRAYKVRTGNSALLLRRSRGRAPGSAPMTGRCRRKRPMTLARRYIADDDPRAAWSSPAAVLDACLDDAPLALADIPAKLPWKVGA